MQALVLFASLLHNGPVPRQEHYFQQGQAASVKCSARVADAVWLWNHLATLPSSKCGQARPQQEAKTRHRFTGGLANRRLLLGFVQGRGSPPFSDHQSPSQAPDCLGAELSLSSESPRCMVTSRTSIFSVTACVLTIRLSRSSSALCKTFSVITYYERLVAPTIMLFLSMSIRLKSSIHNIGLPSRGVAVFGRIRKDAGCSAFGCITIAWW